MSRAFDRMLAAWLMAAALVLAAGPALAGGAINAGGLGGIAIKGYDTVAYFTMSKAVKGSSAYATDWLGARWYFASQTHLDAFLADPARYAPQFGGYCAGAVSMGFTAEADPEAWRIVDGRLYLLYSKEDLRLWEQQAARNIAEAEAKWPAVKEKLTN